VRTYYVHTIGWGDRLTVERRKKKKTFRAKKVERGADNWRFKGIIRKKKRRHHRKVCKYDVQSRGRTRSNWSTGEICAGCSKRSEKEEEIRN